MDTSIRAGKYYSGVYKFGAYLPAIVWGLLAPLFAIPLLRRYDTVIITSPPESLLIGAWLLQLLGVNVIVDMRDAIERPNQYFNSLVWIYTYFYNKIKRVIVTYQFIDSRKKVIYSGYDDIKGTKFKGYYQGRAARKCYLFKLEKGYAPDQSHKPVGYSSSAVQTLRYLGYPINNTFHPEMYTHELFSVEESAKLYKSII